MKNLILFLLLLFSIIEIFAQKRLPFGEIPIEDIQMTIYHKDSTASAVVLFDYTTIVNFKPHRLQDQFTYRKHIRIKLLNTAGIDWATVEIPFYQKFKTTLHSITAHTVNWRDGKIIKTPVEDHHFFEEKINDDLLIKKFTFPNLKKGSIVEYEYEFTDEYVYGFFHDFQKEIPVRWSEIELNLPQYLQYQFDFNNAIYPMAINEQSGSIIFNGKKSFPSKKYHFAMKDIPALKIEPFVMNMEDYRATLQMFTATLGTSARPIISNWTRLNSKYNREHEETINKKFYFKEAYQLNKSLIKSAISPKEKMIKLYNFITETMEWNGEYMAFLTEFSLNKVFKNRTGSSAEINFLLLALLQKANIEASPLLISTRDNGLVSPTLPYLYQFNHVIIKVTIDGKDYFLDAIHAEYPYNLLEFNNLSILGWQTLGKNAGWIDLPQYKAKTIIQPKLELDTEGQIKGSFDIALEGYPAVYLRQKIKEAENVTTPISAHKEEKEFKEEEITNYNLVNLKDKNKRLLLSFDIETANFAETTEELIYFSPVWLTQFKKNPFKAEQRNHPINLGYQREELYILKLKIPKGYQVESLPKAAKLNLLGNAGTFMFIVKQDSATQISVTSRFKLNEPIIDAHNYSHLKQFFELVAEKHNEQIVLKKIP